MTETEKKLQQEIEILKRRVEMLMDHAGIRDEVLDALRYDEALDAFHERGDRSLLDAYFESKNKQAVA